MARYLLALAFMLVASVAGASRASAALVFTPIPIPPGCVSSAGVKINVHGNAAFNAMCGGKGRSFFYDRLKPLPTPWVVLALPAGAIESVAYDIDDDNFIVGTSIFNANGAKRYPTIWSSSGTANAYHEPTSTDAFGINPSARPRSLVVGQTMVSNPIPQAAAIVPVPLRIIGPLPQNGTNSTLKDVNDGGTAVGALDGVAASSVLPAPLADLPGFPLGISSVANAINANGTIVGSVTTAAQGCPSSYAFATAPGGVQHLPMFQSCAGAAEDINDNGFIVGDVVTRANQRRGVLFAPHALDFNVILAAQFRARGWKLIVDVSGVNNNNEIVGTGINAAGQQEAFVAL